MTIRNTIVARLIMQIPSNVYTKYAEAMSLFAETANFGVLCKLVYKKTGIVTSIPDIKKRLTLGPNGGQSGMLRGTEATRIEETYEEVTLRIYTDKKTFDKVGSYEFLAGSCLSIGPLSLMDNLKRADSMVIFSDRSSDQIYERSGEVQIWGLDGNYCVAYWVKV